MKWRRAIFFPALIAVLALAPVRAATGGDLAKRVVILANSDDADSLRIARHYAEVRGVPSENIVAKKMPGTEAITWREFVGSIWQPLYDELVERKWIEVVGSDLTDPAGRKKYVVNSHRIAALVVCRGVPLKIAHEPDFFAAHLPHTNHQQYRSNAGAVDSELSLLGRPNYNINAFVENPLFGRDAAGEFEHAPVIPVGRLDGPTVADALGLVDRAVAAERSGLVGRAYVDIGGMYPQGDQWFEAVAAQLPALGFDRTVDRAGSTLPATARADAPVLYFGWYAGDLNGPFALPGFQFPPGAIALHIHSFSAGTLRSANHGWAGPLVARGITATVGNVYEPYLARTHRPDLLLAALARGATLGEAACYSLSALSWQAILIGDPLYRPFAISVDEQWKNRAKQPLAAYLVLRRMHLLERANQPAEALALAREVQRATPSLPVGLGLAERLRANGDIAGAGAALAFAARLKNFRTDEWGLAREVAQMLATCERPSEAMQVYQALFAIKALPRELRVAWLHEASGTAYAAGNSAQSLAWDKELAELAPPVLP